MTEEKPVVPPRGDPIPMVAPAPAAPKTIEPSRVAVIVLSRTPELLEFHLASHALYTPEEVPIVIVDTSDLAPEPDAPPDSVPGVPAEEEEEDEGELAGVEAVYEIAAQENLTYLDCRPGAPCRPVAGGFYGNFCNAGAREAIRVWEPELLVFANDDTVVGPDWLALMLSDLAEVTVKGGEPVGLLGARSNYVSGPQSVYDRTLLPYGITGETVFPYPRIVTFFAAIRAKTFEDVGGFDEDLPAHNHSDDVLSCRLLRKGFMNWISRAFIAHAGSQTFARAGKDPEAAMAGYAEDMKRGEEYVLEHYPEASGLFGQTLQRCYPALGGAPEGDHAGAG